MTLLHRHTSMLLLAAMALLGMWSCNDSGDREVENPAPSVYYWRSTYALTEGQKAWMRHEGIRKMYLHMFDITMRDGLSMPVATVSFKDSLPQGVEVIPTVFIEEPVVRNEESIDTLAARIVERVQKMARANGFRYRELQMDCDWTSTSQERYYELLRLIAKADTSVTLSATIRLHQLQMAPPPVSYGALMLYNTGDFRKANSDRNPILDQRDVEPYLRYLRKYPLPLCAAYPNYKWQLLFAGEEFKGILYDQDLNDSTLYAATPRSEGQRSDYQEYSVVGSRTIYMSLGANPLHLIPGEKVKVWSVDKAARDTVRQMVEKYRPGINKQIITYHLSAIE